MSKKLLFKILAKTSVISLVVFCTVSLQSKHLKKISEVTLSKNIYQKQVQSKNIQLSLFKKMPAFGFDNLVADLAMLEFMQYFGDGKARKATGHSLSDDYLEVIANNDPRFVRAYMFISPVSSIFGGTPKRTIALLNKALEHLNPDMPEAYFIWVYKGMDEILFFGDLKQAKRSYKKAAEWAAIAGDEKIIKSANNTVKYLAENPDTSQAQVGIWLQVWVNNKEKATRDLAKQKIEQLGGELKIHPNGEVHAIPPNTSES